MSDQIVDAPELSSPPKRSRRRIWIALSLGIVALLAVGGWVLLSGRTNPKTYDDPHTLMTDVLSTGQKCSYPTPRVPTDIAQSGAVCILRGDPFLGVSAVVFPSNSEKERAHRAALALDTPETALPSTIVEGDRWAVTITADPYDRKQVDALAQKVVEATGGTIAVDFCSVNPDVAACTA